MPVTSKGEVTIPVEIRERPDCCRTRESISNLTAKSYGFFQPRSGPTTAEGHASSRIRAVAAMWR